MEKEGTIGAVSRFAGIKFKGEEKWFNAGNDKIKDKVMKTELKGKNTSLLLNEVGHYVEFTIKNLEKIEVAQETINSVDTQGLIVRQTCIKAACDLGGGNVDVKKVLEWAAEFEKWVNR